MAYTVEPIAGVLLMWVALLVLYVRSGAGFISDRVARVNWGLFRAIALVGSSDYTAKTTVFRMVFLFNSLVGMWVMSLALTYIMQVYNALQSRNTLAMTIDQVSRSRRDAAKLIQALAPGNKFDAGYSHLSSMADAFSAIREAHDFYPVLFYFRFPEPRSAAARTALMSLDTVSLLRAAIPDGESGWIKHSAALTQLWGASLSALTTLECAFVPGREGRPPTPPDPAQAEQWKRRFRQGGAARTGRGPVRARA